MVGVFVAIAHHLRRSPSMSTTTLRLTVLFCAAALAAACSDDAATSPLRRLSPGTVNASVSVGTTSIYMLSVEVQGEGVDPGFYYDLSLQGGKSKQNLTLPSGADRSVRIRGYDQYGQLTHQATLSFPKVSDGLNNDYKITLA